jgi:hypothetical protein
MPVENGLPVAELRTFVNSISWRNCFRDRLAALLAKPTEGGYSLNTTRLSGSCLCAISQLGSYMSCKSENEADPNSARALRVLLLRFRAALS